MRRSAPGVKWAAAQKKAAAKPVETSEPCAACGKPVRSNMAMRDQNTGKAYHEKCYPDPIIPIATPTGVVGISPIKKNNKNKGDMIVTRETGITIIEEDTIDDSIVSAPKAVLAKREAQVTQRALEIEKEADTISQALKSLTADDIDKERLAVRYRDEVIKVATDQAHEIYDEIVKTAQDALDTAKGKLNGCLKPLGRSDKNIRDGLTEYYIGQQKRAAEAQKKADEEQAAKERQAAVHRDQERAQLEDKIMAQIAELPDDLPNYDDHVEKLMAQLEPMSAPVEVVQVKVSTPVTTGAMSLQDNWSCVITDLPLIVEQIVAGDLPWSLIEVRQPEANRLAKLYKDQKTFKGMKFVNNPFTRGSGR